MGAMVDYEAYKIVKQQLDELKAASIALIQANEHYSFSDECMQERKALKEAISRAN